MSIIGITKIVFFALTLCFCVAMIIRRYIRSIITPMIIPSSSSSIRFSVVRSIILRGELLKRIGVGRRLYHCKSCKMQTQCSVRDRFIAQFLWYLIFERTQLSTHTSSPIMAAATATSPTAEPLPKWQTIIFPLIAGLLHLQVFYYAAVHCIFRAYFKSATVSVSSDEFRNECFLLDRAIFMAYVFDLLCCYFKVIPFSSKFIYCCCCCCVLQFCIFIAHISYINLWHITWYQNINNTITYKLGCNCSRDIIGHHVPTLLMALPLAIPLWSHLSLAFGE